MKPVAKASGIRGLQSALMGTDVVKKIEEDQCVSCKGPATEFRDGKSRREFGISGFCQKCQDEVFGQ